MDLRRMAAQLAARSRTRPVRSPRRFPCSLGNYNGPGCRDIGIDVCLEHQSPRQ